MRKHNRAKVINTLQCFGDNFKYLVSISNSLTKTNPNKLIQNLLNLIHNNPQSSAKYLYELSTHSYKRNYQSQKFKKLKGEIDHTLTLFNDSSIDLKQISQLTNGCPSLS